MPTLMRSPVDKLGWFMPEPHLKLFKKPVTSAQLQINRRPSRTCW